MDEKQLEKILQEFRSEIRRLTNQNIVQGREIETLKSYIRELEKKIKFNKTEITRLRAFVNKGK